MRFAPFLATLIAVLSFSLTSNADENVIRIPLARRSFTHPPASRAGDAVGYVDKEFLKTHVTNVAAKYRTGFAAYEVNTGFPHPLTQSISAIVGGVGATLPGGEPASGPLSAALGGSPSPVLSRGSHPKRDGGHDIPLSEVDSNMWIGTISVGTPPQNFTVDFDTGSGDLILPDQACSSTCDGHTRYNHTDSSTAVNLNRTFQTSYRGGANVNGTQYADNVFIGGYEAVNQTLGVATTYSSAMRRSTFSADGLLGLGFPPLSVSGASPVFQTMVSNGVLPQGVFGLSLSSQAGKSELTIGGTNKDLYKEATTEYFNVTLPAYWQIRLAGLFRSGLNGAPDVVVVNRTSYAEAFIDTGTTLITTSDSNAQAFYANVTGAKPSTDIGGGAWTVPCDTIDSVVPTLTFGSRNFNISSSTFNLGPVTDGSTDCVAGLAGGGGAYWIIGDVFLQNVYTIFDVTNTRVGFADLS